MSCARVYVWVRVCVYVCAQIHVNLFKKHLPHLVPRMSPSTFSSISLATTILAGSSHHPDHPDVGMLTDSVLGPLLFSFYTYCLDDHT